MGPIIPPSVPFILYGVIANVSIGKLFLGGAIPGIMLGAGLMIYMYFIAKKRKYPRQPRASLKEILRSGFQALPALFMPVLIMGGILAGMFTPTEAAGVLVAYSLIVGMFLKKELKWKHLPKILLDTGKDSAMVLLLLALSEPFSWVIASEQLPLTMINFISGISSSPIVILLLINVLLIIIGIPMETAPAIAIVTPVLAPIAIQLGIDPVHMGVIVCFNLVLGLITPPVGAVLFVTCGMTGMSLEKLSKGVWPPFFIALAVLLLVTYIPALTTFLPNLLMK